MRCWERTSQDHTLHGHRRPLHGREPAVPRRCATARFIMREGPERREWKGRWTHAAAWRRSARVPVIRSLTAWSDPRWRIAPWTERAWTLRILASGSAGDAPRSRTGSGSCVAVFTLLPAASRTSEPVSSPRSAACFWQTSRNFSRSMSRFAARVISAARSARRGVCVDTLRLRSSIAASISARRVEKGSIVARGTQAISKRPSARVFSIS